VMVVRGDVASIDREERLLPYVEEQVVKEVDLDARVMRVDWGRDW
jgi:16S rRNA processing protein RimM